MSMASSSSNRVIVTHKTPEWELKRTKILESLEYFRSMVENEKKRKKEFRKYDLKIDQESRETGSRKRKSTEEGADESGSNLHRSIVKLMIAKEMSVEYMEQVGSVEGVEVGQEFHWRAELVIVGLHHHYEKGIQYVKSLNGTSFATSIVESGRFPSFSRGGELTYRGEGKKTQRATGGNKALLNSCEFRRPVRYIKKINQENNSNKHGYLFKYMGLHHIVTHRMEVEGPKNRHVFVFVLRKLPDSLQYETEWSRGIVRAN